MSFPASSRRTSWLPRIAVAPSVIISLIAVYGFIFWTGIISTTSSRFIPVYDFVGLEQYFRLWATPRWYTAIQNIFVFSVIFLAVTTTLGLVMAILLDQNIRMEGFLRTVYLYPMAVSFIVTGTAWKWVLNPELGIQRALHDLGWTSFKFDWIVNPKMAVYTIVIAGVWQASGFAMAIFLAGLRGIDSSLVKAAQIEGASLPLIYWKIIIPMLRPTMLTVVVLLSYTAISCFDLVVALTNGGPGTSTEFPSTFMFSASFRRNEMAVGAASAVMIFMTIAAIIVPYLYSELRGRKNG